MTILNLDYESRSEVDLKKFGLDVYSKHQSTEIMLAAWAVNGGRVQQWDYNDTRKPPAELREALEDPHVEKHAFNAQFERVMTKRCFGITTPYSSWRCTMVLAYMHSFVGTLKDIGRQAGLPQDQQKMKDGDKLIQLFCKPQKTTAKQPFIWRSILTDPDEWDDFCEYNEQDVYAEMGLGQKFKNSKILQSEWALYGLDQLINDRGLPVDMDFVKHAAQMAVRRKRELNEELAEFTKVRNPNSPAQLLPWLKKKGYPFDDLKKDTVKKVIRDYGDTIDPDLKRALELRQNASRTSVAKYSSFIRATGEGDRFRFAFQMGGAQRTQRWAGRRVQVHNLPHTMKLIEPQKGDISKLSITTDFIRRGEYDNLALMVGEPMLALVGCIRSSIRAPKGQELRVCDLSSIETAVIASTTGCQRLLKVFADGKDPYKDFGTVLYSKPYDEVTKQERTNSKPAVLGSGYRLGGGALREGKRTGLWGYAENMGVNLTQEEAVRATELFRETYHEIPKFWYQLERAIELCIIKGVTTTAGPVKFIRADNYLKVVLPSGRIMHYYKPMIIKKVPPWGGEPKKNFSYMGQDQKTKKWVRIVSHGGKMLENLVQAIARDILKEGMLNAHKAGFNIIGHVHDEIITLQNILDKIHTVDFLRECMIKRAPWYKDIPLNAAGWSGPFYMKD